MLFLCHPACTTCAKARAFLNARGFKYTERDIRQERPTEAELVRWHHVSGLPLKRFFNTSGNAYRELGLSKKLDGLDQAAQLKLLASDGMLVRRPILAQDGLVLVGFNEKTWAAALDN